MPRRDHNCVLITKGKYMLIYGGKNGKAFTPNSDALLP